MHLLTLLCCSLGVFSIRDRRLLRKGQTGGWTTTTDDSRGPCAQHVKEYLPIHFPLHCTGQADSLTFSATAIGWGHPRLQLSIDDVSMGYRQFPIHRAKRTWEVQFNSLSAGLHIIKYSGDRMQLKSLVLQGQGAPCSFDSAPGFSEASASYTYRGFDVLNRLFGPDQNTSEFKKQQLHFASQTIGQSIDGSIDATAVAEGFWKWLFMYSQSPSSADPWLSEQQKGLMWEESNITPYLSVSLRYLPGHDGQSMEVCEPCNGLSSLAFHEAAIWISCKGYPFERDEYASLMAAFNSLAAGSAFRHTCGCSTGGQADTFTMDWLMLQTYQVAMKEVVRLAGSGISDTQRDAVLNLGVPARQMTDLARELTALFRQDYDHATWHATVQSMGLPAFGKPIVGLLFATIVAFEDRWPLPGLGDSLRLVLDAILELFPAGDAEWFRLTYFPAVQQTMFFITICSDAVMDVLEHMLKFILTFVEAMVFQEQHLAVPAPIQDILGWFDDLGLTSSLHSDMKVNWDYYNGNKCRARSEHASWHEKASHGLVHIMKVTELFVTRGKGGSEEC